MKKNLLKITIFLVSLIIYNISFSMQRNPLIITFVNNIKNNTSAEDKKNMDSARAIIGSCYSGKQLKHGLVFGVVDEINEEIKNNDSTQKSEDIKKNITEAALQLLECAFKEKKSKLITALNNQIDMNSIFVQKTLPATFFGCLVGLSIYRYKYGSNFAELLNKKVFYALLGIAGYRVFGGIMNYQATSSMKKNLELNYSLKIEEYSRSIGNKMVDGKYFCDRKYFSRNNKGQIGYDSSGHPENEPPVPISDYAVKISCIRRAWWYVKSFLFW